MVESQVQKGDSHAKSAICVRRASDCRNDRLDRRRDGGRSDSRSTRYIVLYEPNASPAALKGAVKQAGGRILRANGKVGVATVVSSNTRFRAEAARSAVIDGVARNVPIGKARPSLRPKVSGAAAYAQACSPGYEGGSAERATGNGLDSHNLAEPLAPLQWDMRMIHATPDGSYHKEKGSNRVLVGILDTGIDGNHPDIASNFNRSLAGTSPSTSHSSTARVPTSATGRATTRTTSTRTRTAPTWRALLPRRSTASGSQA